MYLYWLSQTWEFLDLLLLFFSGFWHQKPGENEAAEEGNWHGDEYCGKTKNVHKIEEELGDAERDNPVKKQAQSCNNLLFFWLKHFTKSSSIKEMLTF